MKNFLALMLLLFLVKDGISCSCIFEGDFSIKKEFKERDVVFYGKVTDIDTIDIEFDTIYKMPVKELWYTFQVIQFYKGKLEIQSIKIRSGIVMQRIVNMYLQ